MNKGINGSICSSIKEVSYEQFEWKVECFSSLVETSDCYYTSPRFSFNDNMWSIRLYPNECNGRYLALSLSPTKVPEPVFIHFTFGIKKEDGCIEQWFSGNNVFTSDKGWGEKGSIEKSEFLKRELVRSDSLNIIFIMSTRFPRLTKYALDQSFHLKADDYEDTSHMTDALDQSFQLKADDYEDASHMTGSEKLLSDIRKLFVTGDESDVVIGVQDTEFKAHRTILAARIPPLSAMFQHETAEKASNKINITDCEPTIFKEFLCYIYTGTIQNSTADIIYGLYRIADKYLVDDLKLLCRKYIQSNLNVETFCDTIELAQIYDDKDIHQHAIDYFAIHFRLIIRRKEWLRYMQENTKEANEILIKSFGSP